MAGNSQRKGAMRKAGTKKGMTVGSGGNRRDSLSGRGPTPKATERPHHPAAKRKKAVEKKATKSDRFSSGGSRSTSKRTGSSARTGSVLAGRNPVVEALRAKIPATALYVQTKSDADDRMRESLRLASAAGIPMLEVTRVELDRMTEGAVHQGLVLTVPEYEYRSLSDVSSATMLVALDGVTDPRNLGAIVRSAAAFGAGGVIIPERRSAGVTATAWKASAGALTSVPVAQVTNMTRTIEALQKQGFMVIGLDVNKATPLAEIPKDVWTDPVLIVVGSEGSGLSRLVSASCDYRVTIPMTKKAESLNASVAAAIVLQTAFAARS
ncbi:MAG: 23S rRNA (guanosine(2251)-2'-O)-methyltransferase RlmB [Candidatus Nanopelagicales bacterium]|jgi:23S rRNA (guanosine2251-2'-O)-methyltransferase|nr:23S rRNA (guanosine(2251)-2'-O)-methyltransferase RlmB [Candidatus Nanopelagicales bacterium]